MNWRAIMRGEATELYSHNSHNPQNPTNNPNIEDIEDIAKGVEPELMARVSEACAGLDMTPEQLIRVLNSEGKEQIISGDLTASTLKDYAKKIDEAINDGVVSLIMERINIS